MLRSLRVAVVALIVIILSSLFQFSHALALVDQHKKAQLSRRRCCSIVTRQYNINQVAVSKQQLFNRKANSDGITDSSRNGYNDRATTGGLLGPRRIAYLLVWASFVGYAFTIAPGGNADATALDNELIKTMITAPFDGSISPIFVALFNSLGVLPAVYASLLLPGGKIQKVPALPFVIGSFALGFFGIGPYLGIRTINTTVTNATRGRGSGAFEFKGASMGMLAFAAYLLYYAIYGDFDGDRVQSFVELFNNQKLVHVSSLDFTILSIALIDPLKEDMKRRDFQFNPVFLFPIFGPVAYLILRPALRD